MQTEIFSKAHAWAQKRGINPVIERDCIRIRCPRCHRGEILVENEHLYAFCTNVGCRAQARNERELDTLFV